MIQQLTSNWVCWAIAITALVCYQQLWAALFDSKSIKNEGLEITRAAVHGAHSSTRHNFCGVLIGALPLLGLLGTIIGLLDCFASMAQQGADSEQLSNGIADALLTTQLGLVCAIPAWLLQGYIRSRQRMPASIGAK